MPGLCATRPLLDAPARLPAWPGPHLLDESEVVADQHHTALKLIDGIGQGIDGLDVQVVGGLVQEEHVGVLPGQPGQAHAALLPIRQVPDWAHLSATVTFT